MEPNVSDGPVSHQLPIHGLAREGLAREGLVPDDLSPDDLWFDPTLYFPSPEQLAQERRIEVEAQAVHRALLEVLSPEEWSRHVTVLDDASPEPSLPNAGDVLAELASQGSDSLAVMMLESIDPLDLECPLDRINYLKAVDRIEARTAAMRVRALAAIAGSTSAQAYLTEAHIEHEVALARRTSSYAAGRAIETARSLVSDFPSFYIALETGEVSVGHCSVLVDKTRVVADPEKLAVIERIVLPKARRLTPGEFGREVSKAIMRVDARAAAERHRQARAARQVIARECDEGMGFLGVTDDWVTINALYRTLTSDARALQRERGGARAAMDDDAALGSCRADALATRVLGKVIDDGSISWQRSDIPVSSALVIDLHTLRGEHDSPCLLDGQPIPAEIGREMARGVGAWRRMVTDPVTGHLLDYGRESYLPEALRRFIGVRDGGCRAPGCRTSSSARVDMDHATSFPGGPSDTSNTGMLCRSPHHQLKSAGYLEILDGEADGSCTWATLWGQRITIAPRPLLHDPADGYSLADPVVGLDMGPAALGLAALGPDDLGPAALGPDDPGPDDPGHDLLPKPPDPPPF